MEIKVFETLNNRQITIFTHYYLYLQPINEGCKNQTIHCSTLNN